MVYENITKKIIRIILPFIGLLFLGYLVFALINIFIILIIAVLLSFILRPLVAYLEFLKIPRAYSSLLSVLFAIGLISFLFYYFVPIIANQFDSILVLLRDLRIQDLISSIEKRLLSIFPFIKRGTISQNFANFIQNFMDNLFKDISDLIPKLLTITAFTLIVPFITFFILKDSRRLKLEIINLLPNRYFEMAYEIFQKVNDELGRYVRAWIFDAAFVGILAMIGLYIMGINNFAMLGLLAGIGHLIPYLGPLIGIIPSILIAYYQFGNFSLAIPLIIMFALIYTIDNGFFQPMIYSKSLKIHPVAIILLILIGSELFGILGLFLAVPVANIIKVLATEIYRGYKAYKIVHY